jgi:hypothetical protein
MYNNLVLYFVIKLNMDRIDYIYFDPSLRRGSSKDRYENFHKTRGKYDIEIFSLTYNLDKFIRQYIKYIDRKMESGEIQIYTKPHFIEKLINEKINSYSCVALNTIKDDVIKEISDTMYVLFFF